jgi:uncharacterized membrane protein YeaQ/YmgE (transglycosylase-associated protein family)
MELAINLGIGAMALVVVVAIAFGVVAQLVGDAKTGYEWLADAVGFLVGAIVASEFIIAWQAIEPVWDGLALIPALLGGLVVGLVVELLTRFTTGGSYTHRAMTV